MRQVTIYVKSVEQLRNQGIRAAAKGLNGYVEFQNSQGKVVLGCQRNQLGKQFILTLCPKGSNEDRDLWRDQHGFPWVTADKGTDLGEAVALGRLSWMTVISDEEVS